MFRGKKYQDSVKLVEKSKFYDTNEAMDLITKTAKAKFDETVEAHIRLGVDSRHADQVLLYFRMVQVRLQRFWYSLRVLRLTKQRLLVQITLVMLT